MSPTSPSREESATYPPTAFRTTTNNHRTTTAANDTAVTAHANTHRQHAPLSRSGACRKHRLAAVGPCQDVIHSLRFDSNTHAASKTHAAGARELLSPVSQQFGQRDRSLAHHKTESPGLAVQRRTRHPERPQDTQPTGPDSAVANPHLRQLHLREQRQPRQPPELFSSDFVDRRLRRPVRRRPAFPRRGASAQRPIAAHTTASYLVAGYAYIRPGRPRSKALAERRPVRAQSSVDKHVQPLPPGTDDLIPETRPGAAPRHVGQPDRCAGGRDAASEPATTGATRAPRSAAIADRADPWGG